MIGHKINWQYLRDSPEYFPVNKMSFVRMRWWMERDFNFVSFFVVCTVHIWVVYNKCSHALWGAWRRWHRQLKYWEASIHTYRLKFHNKYTHLWIACYIGLCNCEWKLAVDMRAFSYLVIFSICSFYFHSLDFSFFICIHPVFVALVLFMNRSRGFARPFTAQVSFFHCLRVYFTLLFDVCFVCVSPRSCLRHLDFI